MATPLSSVRTKSRPAATSPVSSGGGRWARISTTGSPFTLGSAALIAWSQTPDGSQIVAQLASPGDIVIAIPGLYIVMVNIAFSAVVDTEGAMLWTIAAGDTVNAPFGCALQGKMWLPVGDFEGTLSVTCVLVALEAGDHFTVEAVGTDGLAAHGLSGDVPGTIDLVLFNGAGWVRPAGID